MGRKESLYNRLDQLEAEFAEYLLKELDIIVRDHASRFLYRQTSSYPEGNFFRSTEIAEAERTEKEIYDALANSIDLLEGLIGWPDGNSLQRYG